MSKRNRVPKLLKSPEKMVMNPLVAKSNRDSVWFDFRNHNWTSSVKDKNFTNFLNSREEYMKNHFYLFHTLVPKVMDEWPGIIAREYQYKHCHRVDEEALDKSRRIFEQIYGYSPGNDVDFWQLGFIGSVRLVCISHAAENALIPVFIDHHHLLYSSEKHNQFDYKHYSYCPICDYVKGKYEDSIV